jgi:hypothetical protein
MGNRQRSISGLVAVGLAAALWLPSVRFFFRKPDETFFSPSGVPLQARALAARHLQIWTEPGLKIAEVERMRQSNSEWDFMGRSFLVWSMAEMGLRDPAVKPACLPVMDRIIEETIQLEQERGIYFFLMPYAKARPYVAQPPRSHFVDGEIALMLAMRRMLEEKEAYRPLLNARVNVMIERMKRSKVLAAESYPDECWMFDHAVGLAAIRLADYLDGSDHGELFREWIATARKELVHANTGLLVSSFSTSGAHLDGPEGSSIWMVAHCLRLIDPEFAQDQYRRARKELGRDWLGFAYSREWPVSWKGPVDIDSGVVIPILGASPGGSGLAFIGASSFCDLEFLSKLHASLDLAAFPVREHGRLRYCASNAVGDAAMLYGTVLGPMWQQVLGGRRK